MNVPRSPLVAVDSGDSIESVVATVLEFSRPLWLDLIRCDQSARWHAGAGVAVERYLELLPALGGDPEEVLVLICAEVLARRDADEQVKLEEYQSRFPDFADELATQFELDGTFGTLSAQPAFLQDHDRCAFHLPGYHVLDEIGRGSSSIVYLARQISVDRLVAIKVLSAWGASANQLNRHRQEAAILSRMKHPNVVQVYDVIETDGMLCSVIEYVDGKTLSEFTGNQPLPPREAAVLARALAKSMIAVHEAGILHRDLKPSNVLISAGGDLKVMDFGLAKLLSGDSHLTTHQCLLGTPSYMPPELTTGDVHVGAVQGDIYSIGAILYELLTGRPPFLGATILDTLTLIRHREPIPPRASQPQTPRDLETICLKCLAKNPADRYRTAADLVGDLERYLTGVPIHARRPSWLEISARWRRRYPAVAALSASLLLTALAGFAGVVWQWREAEQSRVLESAARRDANLHARKLADGLERLKLSNAFLDRGHRYVVERLWDHVEQDFTRAIELRPDHLQAWQVRSEFLYMKLGLFDLAAHDMARAFKLQTPNFADRLLWHATLRLTIGDRDGYQEVCQLMQREMGHSVLIGLAGAAVRTHCLAPQTVETQRQMLEITTALALCHPASADVSYLHAAACMRAGQATEAIALCHQVLATQGQGFPRELSLPILALAFHSVGQEEQARAALEQAEAVMDKWIAARCDVGSDSWAISHGAPARWPVSCWHWLEFEIYLRESRDKLGLVNRADPRLHLLRARALAGLRRLDEAQHEYALAISSMPTDLQVRLEAIRIEAQALALNRRFDQAADAFARASELSPEDCRLMSYRALMLAAGGHTADYEMQCGEVMRRFGNSTDSNVAHQVAVACLLRPNAVPDLDRLVAVGQLAAKSYLSAMRMLGAAHYRAGQYPEAVQYLRQATQLDRPKPWDLAFLAMAQATLGNHREARQALVAAEQWIQEATHPDPNDVIGKRASWGGWYEKVHVPILLEEARQVVRAREPSSFAD